MQKSRDSGLTTLIINTLLASLGTFLFGFEIAIIGGALICLTDECCLTTIQQQLVVSSLLFGSIFGALGGGALSDWIGRRRVLLSIAILFLIGTTIVTQVYQIWALMIARCISGIACGIAAVVVPLYVAEISPPHLRGRLVSTAALMTTIGILVAFLVATFYASSPTWRTMFWFGSVPAVTLLIGTFFIPESPAWSMRQRTPKEKITLRYLFSPEVRTPVLIGVGINVFQQITGINTTTYYGPKIFQMAGCSSAKIAIFGMFVVTFIEMVMTFVGLMLVDRLGRRPLAIYGLTGMALAFVLLGSSFLICTANVGWIALIAFILYVASFAPGLGIVTSLLTSEIYPLAIRGRAMSIALFANWVANYFVSLTFLTLLDYLTVGGTYLFYAAICLLAILFIWRFVPETKGKTFAEIQEFWSNK